MPVLAGLLTLATLGSTAFAAPSFSLPQAAAYFSSILCAPNAALAATRRVLDDAMDEDAVPTAQPIDEDDPEAGFWTVGPTEEEMLPQSEAQSVSSGASSVPDGPIPMAWPRCWKRITSRARVRAMFPAAQPPCATAPTCLTAR